MATRKSAAAADAELQKAEKEYHQLHPLASQGNDVAPVTRGELRIILEDLLTKLASGTPIKLQKDEKAIRDLQLAASKLELNTEKLAEADLKAETEHAQLALAISQLTDRIVALEGGSAAPAAPAASAKAPQLNRQGWEQFMALGRKGMFAYAKSQNIDVQGFKPDGDDDRALAEYLAINENLIRH